MPLITDFLKEALTTSHTCHIVESVPKDKAIGPNDYYLFKSWGNWKLRYKQDGKIVTIEQKDFSNHKGLENLLATLSKPVGTMASTGTSSTASTNSDAVKIIIQDFHMRDRSAITAKIRQSLRENDLGFISRIFSDLHSMYLEKKEREDLADQYKDLLKDLSKEYKRLVKAFKITDEEDFLTLDRDHIKTQSFNQTVALFNAWLKHIIARGQQELFDNNGGVKPEIIDLLVNSINPDGENIEPFISQFKQDVVKQGLLSAYAGLVFQEIIRSLPDAFMHEIPHMVKNLASKLIKSNTVMVANTPATKPAPVELSERKMNMPDLEDVDAIELTKFYQNSFAAINATTQKLIHEVTAHVTDPKHAETLFDALSKIKSASVPSSPVDIIATLQKFNYTDPSDKVFYNIMLLAAIFTGKDNLFTKEQQIWTTLSITEDFVRRRCGQEALDFFKGSVAQLEPITANIASTPSSVSNKK